MKKIFLLSLFIILTATACTTKNKNTTQEIGLEDAKVKATEFINDYLMGAGQKVSIKEAVSENGLYKVVVNMSDGQEVDSYISKDGKTFFPSGMNIEEFKAKKDGAKDTKESSTVAKAEKPKVELFVMSHCPFGTQIEKGILPVLDTLGDSIDFELKFCDYAMHGEKELNEELSQYCIIKNNPEKLNDYLKCFLEDETKGDACLAQVGINKSEHDACVAATDKKFKVKEMYADKSTWKSGRFPTVLMNEEDNKKYGVSGSPTLVINGSKASSARDSASLLKTICSGFDKKPEACQTELSAASPSAGFGFKTGGSTSSASCGG